MLMLLLNDRELKAEIKAATTLPHYAALRAG
jgi:hypothetical protein